MCVFEKKGLYRIHVALDHTQNNYVVCLKSSKVMNHGNENDSAVQWMP